MTGNAILRRLRAADIIIAETNDHQIRAVPKMAYALIIYPVEYTIITESHFGFIRQHSLH